MTCPACGFDYSARPQNYGEEHRCGQREWAVYQNSLLKQIIGGETMFCMTCGRKKDGAEEYCTRCGNAVFLSADEAIAMLIRAQTRYDHDPAATAERMKKNG